VTEEKIIHKGESLIPKEADYFRAVFGALSIKEGTVTYIQWTFQRMLPLKAVKLPITADKECEKIITCFPLACLDNLKLSIFQWVQPCIK
jgi:hypothetical protein